MSSELPDATYVLKEETSIHSLLFWEDKLLAGINGGQISKWSLKTFRKSGTILTLGTSACMCMKLLDDTLVTQEKEGNLKFWKFRTDSWSLLKSTDLDYCGFCKIDSTTNGNIIVCPKKNAVVELYSLQSHIKVMSFKAKNEFVTLGDVMAVKVIYIRQNPYVLAAYENGELRLWDFRTQGVVSHLKNEDCVISLDFSESDMKGVCGGVNDYLVVFNIDGNCHLNGIKTLKITNPGANSIKIRDDNKIMAAGCWDGSIRVYSWKSLRPLAVLQEHLEEINDISFFTYGKQYLVVGGKDRKISLWDIYNKAAE
ncbi:hypothetical protein ANN_19137 [Periplaneta americana]|uniref:Guanine nucleotide-binding protein subunit beta-like protein 1 n=1 Tax=Periplaneta americana TaxID=6978 RepID=A0ABQ8S9K0_PERAM|nr:hypothetical protein ANN_19137 [Periplaneta americana]